MRYNLHGKGVPFQQIALTLSINSTEIGTLCPKITQKNKKILLSNLCSPLYAHAVTFPEYEVRATGIVPASVHVDPPTGQAVNTNCWPCWSPSAATRETGSLGGTIVEPTTAGNEARLDITWATEVEGWLASAKAPITEGPAKPVELQAEDSVERLNQTVKAFWALLKQAGYEEV